MKAKIEDRCLAALSAGVTNRVTETFGGAGHLVYTLNPDGSSAAYAYTELGDAAGTVRIGAGQALSFDRKRPANPIGCLA